MLTSKKLWKSRYRKSSTASTCAPNCKTIILLVPCKNDPIINSN